MRLSEAETGQEYVIDNLNRLGRGIRRRMLAFGISDCKFKIIHNSGAGPMLLEIRGTRIAIGRGMTEKIYIKKEITECQVKEE